MNNSLRRIILSLIVGLGCTVLTLLHTPKHLVAPATSIFEHGYPFTYYWTGYADFLGGLNQIFFGWFLVDLCFWSVISFFGILFFQILRAKSKTNASPSRLQSPKIGQDTRNETLSEPNFSLSVEARCHAIRQVVAD